MADIRINSLPTTASASSSDDFLALDGATNGTRKLNAYSPTFGGNLTVSGTATLGPTNPFKFDTNVMQSTASGFNGALVRSAVSTVGNPTFSNVDDTDTGIYFPAANTLAIATGGTQRLSVDATATTLAGNLTVSGAGTSSVAGNLGVGTTTPNKLLEAAKNLATNTVGAGEVLRLISDDGNNVGRVTEIGFGVGPTGATYAPITLGAVVTTATGFNKKDFYIATRDSTTDSAPSEKLRLFANGNLFIGASPVDGGQKLQVSGDAAISDVVTFTGGGVSAYTNSTARIYNQAAVGLTLNGSNLQFRTGSSGTTALTLDSSQNATFAGNVTVNGVGNNTIKGDLLFGSGAWPTANYGRSADRVTISSSAGGPVLGLGDMQTGVAANRGATIYLFARGTDGTNDIAGASFISKRQNATSGNFASTVEIGVSTASISNPQTRVTIADATTTFANAIAIGNTVNTVSPTSPNRTITMVIGGTTYYIHAKTTND